MARLLKPVIAESSRIKRGVLAIGCLEGEPLPLASLAEGAAERICQAARTHGWRGSSDRRLQLSTHGDGVSVTLYGLGSSGELDHRRLQAWLKRVAADCAAAAASELLVVPPDHDLLASPSGARTLLRHLGLMSYSFDDYRKPASPGLRRLRLLAPKGTRNVYRAAQRPAKAVARGVGLARDLANTPPNRATPAWMASQARALARRVGAKARVLGPKELRRLGMGALLAVGRGSVNTPRLVRLEVGTRGPVIALVGKGVTFDTGGISIKPGAAMDEMKYDKAGACTVLGAFQADRRAESAEYG